MSKTHSQSSQLLLQKCLKNNDVVYIPLILYYTSLIFKLLSLSLLCEKHHYKAELSQTAFGEAQPG